ncbi:hypothetical protein ACH4E8_29525 [Streptomyces sp. NPDC017979]|uniref:hypothetical protein n=1 Tax=Streptomyces sp. NPDC017979 TaxID=3365024 RepID=UPI0037B85946
MTSTRHTADTITDDALDHLYQRAEKAERAANISDAVTTQTKQLLARRTETLRARAEAAEAAIKRVHAALADADWGGPERADVISELRAALDEQPKDQP